MDKNNFCVVFGGVSGIISSILGGFDVLLKCLMLLMLMDIIAGLCSAAFFNKSQYSKNGLTSNAMAQGIIKKLFILIIVSMGVIINKVLGINYIRNAIILYFIASEGLSILEHMINVGVPFPPIVAKMLSVIMERSDVE